MKCFQVIGCGLALSVLAISGVSADAVVIDFDDRPGRPPPFYEGDPVEPQYIVDDEYLGLGVLFDSGGGGIAIAAAGNPVTTPNVAAATGPGPVLAFHLPVAASFWVGGGEGTVDRVSVVLTDTSSMSYLQAFDVHGGLLGQASGSASDILRVDYPGQIHSVVIQQGPMAFDNFTFDGLVPEPATLSLLTLGGLLATRRRR